MYDKHTWVNNEVITADKLNNLENGVANASENAAPMLVVFTYDGENSSCSATWEELSAHLLGGGMISTVYNGITNVGTSATVTQTTFMPTVRIHNMRPPLASTLQSIAGDFTHSTGSGPDNSISIYMTSEELVITVGGK